MTTPLERTSTEPKVCGQTFAALGSLGIGIHFVHEMVTPGKVPAEVVVTVVLVSATLAFTAAWYRLGRKTRRAAAVVLGALWALAAAEHAVHAVTGGTALDVTGVLPVLGGLTLIFAAYWDHHRPLERSR